MKNNIVKEIFQKDLITDFKKTKKILEKEEKTLNAIIKYCVQVENGYADGLYPEEMKIVATDILDIINEKGQA